MDWPHAPVHRLEKNGVFMVTSGTFKKEHFLLDEGRRTRFMHYLFQLSEHYGWKLQAWAVLSNHYHFIAQSPEESQTLSELMFQLHKNSATAFNKEDDLPGRRVWFQYWDSRITHHTSYMARLNYVHNNPEHHKVVQCAEEYPWCSKAWLIRHSSFSFRKTLDTFRADRLNVNDDF